MMSVQEKNDDYQNEASVIVKAQMELYHNMLIYHCWDNIHYDFLKLHYIRYKSLKHVTAMLTT